MGFLNERYRGSYVIGLALVISTFLVRWQPISGLVYPMSQGLVKLRQRYPWLMFIWAGIVSWVLWFAQGVVQALAVTCVLLFLFAGQPLGNEIANTVDEGAERLARSIRRYFMPLPVLALFGISGVIGLWWLRFGVLPYRSSLNRWFNLTTAQLAGFHWGMMKKSKPALQRSLVIYGTRPASLYDWCLRFLSRVQDDFTWHDVWRTFVWIRWQWWAVAVLALWLFHS